MTNYKPEQFDHLALAKEVLNREPVLAERIVLNCQVQQQDVSMALAEVIRFLSLVAHCKERLTPSKRVDDIWHEFILFTRCYMEFCEKEFGRYIHHQPGGSEDENQRQYNRTLELYEKHFNCLNIGYWCPGSDEGGASCGACHSF